MLVVLWKKFAAPLAALAIVVWAAARWAVADGPMPASSTAAGASAQGIPAASAPASTAPQASPTGAAASAVPPAPLAASSTAPAVATPAAAIPTTGTSPGEAPATADPPKLTVERVEGLIAQVEQAGDLPAEAKRQAIDDYKQCLVELRAAAEWREKTAAFVKAAEQAPTELEALKARIDAEADTPLAIPSKATTDELKQGLAEAETRQKAAQDEQQDLESKQRRRADRREEIPKLDEAARNLREELDRKRTATGEAPDENPTLSQARRLLLVARRIAAGAERESYAQELPSYEATRELLRAKLDDAVRRANLAQKHVAAWKEAIVLRKQIEAESKARDAKFALVTTRPELRPLARENQEIAQRRNAPDGPAAKLAEVRKAAAGAKRQLDRLKSEFAHMKQVAHLSDELGQLLLNQRRLLPDDDELVEAAEARRDEISRTKLTLVELENRRSMLADLDEQVELTVATLGPPIPASARPSGGWDELCDEDTPADLARGVRELLTARRGYLDDLIADYNVYFNALVLEQDKTEQELLKTLESYRAYIDEQILWVRSFPAQAGLSTGDFVAAAKRFGDPQSWATCGVRLWEDARRSPQTWIAALVVFIPFVVLLGKVRAGIARLGEDTQRRDAVSIAPTFRVLLLTLSAASPAPLVLWFLATRLTAAPGADEFTRAVAYAFTTGIPIWATIALVRQTLRRQGLAVAHFGLPAEAADQTRRRLWRLAAVGLPATGVAAFFAALDVLPWQASLGRAAFLVGMGCACRAVHLALHPTSGLLARVVGEVEEFRMRLRRLWYLGGLASPLGLAVLSAAGFHYAALQLAYRLQGTLWLILGCILVRAFLLRWLRVARRRLALEQLRRTADRNETTGTVPLVAVTHRAATNRAATNRTDGAGALTLSAMDVQTRRLLTSFTVLALVVGAWWIWSDLLPALKFLDRWQLYSYVVTTTETVSQEDGPPKVVDVRHLEWITVSDLAWASLFLLMTIIAARNLPGLLEISCLQWLPIDQGARYAATTTARYVIHIVGMIVIGNAVGLQWASIQWLAAAMTVGLGFGLQEIFANFISGLIILFERPIRVGDTVTIGDVSGTVSRIRGRATTIVDWDRKELIVPNKEFITSKLVNWTLTDDVLRTVIRVGVCHTADVRRASELLVEIARANPLVLTDPEPTVAFTQVGPQHLDFELRVFSAGLQSLSPLRHQLNITILRSFHDEAIELAAPSREVFLRTLDGDPPAARQAAQSAVVAPRAA
jgi:potassium-dependent mechanosensitive channel